MSPAPRANRFPTTATTLVHALVEGPDKDAELAADLLARAYYKPIHTYVRLRFCADESLADDLTQGFFAQVIANDKLRGFVPDRVKLRTYIRRCLDSYVFDQHRRATAAKRGGGVAALELDEALLHSDADEPEELLHREWVRRLAELARAELDAELRQKEKTEHLEVFARIHDHDEPPTHDAIAAELGITRTDVNNRLGYARRAYRRILVRLVGQLTASSEERDLELRSLGALAD